MKVLSPLSTRKNQTMKPPLDLRKTENDAQRLIAELDGELDALQAAMQTVRTLEDNAPSKPMQSGADTADSRAERVHASSQLAQARQALTSATFKLEKIRNRLRELERVLRYHLDNWRSDLNVLVHDQGEVKHVADQYRDAQQAANIDMRMIRSLLDRIRSALSRCHQAISLTSHLRKTGPADGTKEVPRTPDIWRLYDPQADHGLVAVTYETVPLLGADRYGTRSYYSMIDYPAPQLGLLPNSRTGSLSEKIIVGLGHFADGNGNDYEVTMPQFHCPLLRGGYSQAGAGKYSANTEI